MEKNFVRWLKKKKIARKMQKKLGCKIHNILGKIRRIFSWCLLKFILPLPSQDTTVRCNQVGAVGQINTFREAIISKRSITS